VLDENPRSKDTQGIKAYNDFVMADRRVENLLLAISGWDYDCQEVLSFKC